MNIRNYQLHCIAARPPFMPYTDPVKWALDHVDLNQRMFHDIENVSIASFHPDVFERAYALETPKQLFSPKFFDETLTKFNNEQVVKSWMEEPTLAIPISLLAYPVSWFRESFSLLAAMFCRLFGLPNCSLFKAKWVPMENHVFLIGDSFKWAQIVFCNLRVEIEKYQRTSANQKPYFYMSGFIMDALCECSCLP